VVWLRVIPRFRGFDILALAGVLIGGYPIFTEAITDLLTRRMTMELSLTNALLAASAIRGTQTRVPAIRATYRHLFALAAGRYLL
jgi:hypothetical protein